MITINIDVTKLEERHYHVFPSGKFAVLRILRHRDGVDQFGNAYMVTQAVSAAAYKADDKGNILGNGKDVRVTHSAPLIIANIELGKIDKSKIYVGKKGRYLSCSLTSPTKADGDLDCDYVVRQDVGAEARMRGEKGPRIGIANKSEMQQRGENREQRPVQEAPHPTAPPEVPGETSLTQGGPDDDGEYPF